MLKSSALARVPLFDLENLEDRRLLSAVHDAAIARHEAHLAHLAHMAHMGHLAHLAHLAHLRHLSHVNHVAAAARFAGSPFMGEDASENENENDPTVTFAASPAAVKTGLQAIAPAGIVIPNNQQIDIEDQDGKTVYSTEIKNAAGKPIKLAVDPNGKVVAEDQGQNDNQEGDSSTDGEVED